MSEEPQARRGLSSTGGASAPGLRVSVPCVVIVKDGSMRMSPSESEVATDQIDRILRVGKYKHLKEDGE